MESNFQIEPLAVVARYQKAPPVNPFAIASELGIKVYSKPLGDQVSGMLMRDSVNGGPSGFAIFLNMQHAKNRQRFTLAHEIAHFILHRDLIDSGLVDDTMYRSSLSNLYEVQANRMAADILMPIRLIKATREGKSVAEMASLFEVSEAAMKIRLDSLKNASYGATKAF